MIEVFSAIQSMCDYSQLVIDKFHDRIKRLVYEAEGINFCNFTNIKENRRRLKENDLIMFFMFSRFLYFPEFICQMFEFHFISGVLCKINKKSASLI